MVEALRRRQVSDEDILLATDSDLDFVGNYAERWLVVTAHKLLTFALEPDGAYPVTDLDLAALEGVRVDARVGSGFLQVRAERGWVNVLRFSNAESRKFAKVVAKLRARLDGMPLVVTADDDRDIRRCPTCGRMVPEGASTCPRCISKRHVFTRFFRLMTPYWRYVAAAIALLVVSIALNLVPPRLTKMLVDNVFGNQPPPRWFAWLASLLSASDDKVGWLGLLVLSLAATQLVLIVVRILSGRLSTTIGNRIAYDMRLRLYRRLQTLSVRYYDRHQVGSLMTRCSQDVEQLQGFIWQLTNGFLYNFLIIVGVLVVLFTMNARLALFVLIPIPFVLGSTYVFWRYVQPRYYRFWDSRSKIANVLYAALSGVRVIKAFAQEGREHTRVQQYSDRLRRSRMSVDIASSTFYPIVGFVFDAKGLIADISLKGAKFSKLDKKE